jgi:hypothetical protein
MQLKAVLQIVALVAAVAIAWGVQQAEIAHLKAQVSAIDAGGGHALAAQALENQRRLAEVERKIDLVAAKLEHIRELLEVRDRYQPKRGAVPSRDETLAWLAGVRR